MGKNRVYIFIIMSAKIKIPFEGLKIATMKEACMHCVLFLLYF